MKNVGTLPRWMISSSDIPRPHKGSCVNLHSWISLIPFSYRDLQDWHRDYHDWDRYGDWH